MAVYYPKNFQMIVASMVNWMVNNQHVITDFNKGAVTRTMLEAVSLELEEIHFRIFDALGLAIAEAVYDAFYFPRLPSVRATGFAKFSRTTPATSDITIPTGAVLQTPGDSQNASKQYEVVDEGKILYGNATFNIDSFVAAGSEIFLTAPNGDKSFRFAVGEAFTVQGSVSNDGAYTVLSASYVSPKTLVVVNEPVVNEPAPLAAILIIPGRTVLDDVAIRSILYGSIGNTAPGTVTNFNFPILDIEKVTNPGAIGGGIDSESDANRRARFNLFIQSLARGTLGSLEFAALNVPSIVTARAVDSQPVFAVAYDRGEAETGGTDYSTEANTPHEQEFALIETGGPSLDSGMFALSSEVQFPSAYIELSQPGVQRVGFIGTSGDWWYWDGLALSLCTGDPFFDDQTLGLTKSGPVIVGSNILAVWKNQSFPGGDQGKAQGRLVFPLYFIETTTDADGFDVLPKAIQIFTNPEPGVVYVYVSEANGVLSNDTKKLVEDSINGYIDPTTLGRVMGYRAGGVRVEVRGPVSRLVNIEVAVTAATNYNPSDVQKLVEMGLGNFTNSFVLGQSLYVSELIQYIMNLHDEAIRDVQIVELEGNTTPPIPDVIASPNQLISLYGIVVTVA